MVAEELNNLLDLEIKRNDTREKIYNPNEAFWLCMTAEKLSTK